VEGLAKKGQGALEAKLEALVKQHLGIARQYGGFKRVPREVEVFASDPVWSVFGMADVDLVRYKYIGNYITSIFRKFGDLYEGFVKEIVKHQLGLTDQDLAYRTDIMIDGRARGRSIDLVILVDRVREEEARRRVERAMQTLLAENSGLEGDITSFLGCGFEVRCCYQIGDSKRIQADEDMGISLREASMIPVLMIFCTNSLRSPVTRLRRTWVVTEGMESYEYLMALTGFDLYGFLGQRAEMLQQEMAKVMEIFKE